MTASSLKVKYQALDMENRHALHFCCVVVCCDACAAARARERRDCALGVQDGPRPHKPPRAGEDQITLDNTTHMEVPSISSSGSGEVHEGEAAAHHA